MTVQEFRVLAIGAPADARESMRSTLVEAGYELVEADTWAAARDLASEIAPGLILLDQELADVHWLEAARQLKAARATRRIPIALLKGPGGPLILRRGVGPWPGEVLRRPLDPAALLRVVERARRAREAQVRLGEVGRELRESALAYATDGTVTGRLLGRQVQAELDRFVREGIPVARLRIDLSVTSDQPLDRPARHSIANQVAARIRGSTRQEDLAIRGSDGTYVMLIPGVTEAAARMLGEKVRAALEGAPLEVEDKQLRASALVEVTHWPAGASQATEPSRRILRH